MNRFIGYLIAMTAVVALGGCADMMDNQVHVGKLATAKTDSSGARYRATIRIAGYVDGRDQAGPRNIGKAEVRVLGLTGKDIVLDRDVQDIVSESLRQHLLDAGLPVLDKGDASALFELSGVIKELRYDVKARDHVTIRLDTTLKEVATGKVIWSGEVEQKDEYFAGVSGNSKRDIADQLKKQVGIVTTKTTQAVDSVLQATYPDLFGVTPGTRTIKGVEVFVSPGVEPQVPNNAAMLKPPQQAPGQLVVRTEPAGAKVYLDGVYYGVSPLTIQFAAGIRTVEVKLKGYKHASDKVAVRSGQTTEWETQLEK